MADTFLAPGTTADLDEKRPTTEGGAANAGRVAAVGPDGRFSLGMMPPEVTAAVENADAEDLIAGEPLQGPAITTIAADGQNAGKVVRASAASGSTRKASGHVDAPAAVGDTVKQRNSGKVTGYTNLVPGRDYFLSAAIPGGITLTPPTGAGELTQRVGNAVSTTTLDFEPGPAIKRVGP